MHRRSEFMDTFTPVMLVPELILLGVISLAVGLVYAYLRARAQLDLLRRIWLPVLLWAIFGSLDAMVTMVGTWGAPWQEGNPTTRAFLYWNGWVGLVIGTFLYVLFWAAVVTGLDALRRRFMRAGAGRAAWTSILGGIAGGAQLLTLYALAIGHFFGFLSWTPYFPFWPQLDYLYLHAQWFFTSSPLGY